MSFFKDLVAEVQKELNTATAEFKNDLQKSTAGFIVSPASQGSHTGHGSAGMQSAQSFNSQHGVNSGVIEHPVNRSKPAEQRPKPKKRRKKPPQQAPAAPQPQAVQATKATFMHPHKLVANLTPAVARSSIIMSEVLGPPVSKRQNNRLWHK